MTLLPYYNLTQVKSKWGPPPCMTQSPAVNDGSHILTIYRIITFSVRSLSCQPDDSSQGYCVAMQLVTSSTSLGLGVLTKKPAGKIFSIIIVSRCLIVL